MLTEIVVSLNLFLLVFARLGAMIFPSPVFGRKNVPMRIRAGLVLALTLLLVPVLNAGAVSALSGFDMVEGLVREILLGLIVGFVFQIFFFMIFVAAEFVLEAAMGVLMKLIPQIHIFVINLQVKIIAGILLMMLFAVPMGQFIDRYIGTLFEDVQKLLLQL